MTLKPTQPHPGAALEPTGDPMKDGVGAAAWADRADRYDLTVDGRPRIRPLSVLEGYHLDSRDPDPRGMTVVAGDGVEVGTVSDVWIDLAEPQPRYLTVDLTGGGRVLLPMGFARIKRSGEVRVKAIFGHHFPDVPGLRVPDRITLLEEDRIVAYYAGGYRYAEPSRNEPLL
ncbi:MAG: photosynthetic reaction center subunit H [Gemmatimonadota bacterium]|jgi:photosynthetic reaction center H subunit